MKECTELLFHNCTYCGGYKEKCGVNMKDIFGNKHEHCKNTSISAVVLEDHLGNKREICVRCWIKCFDKVLGKPK